MVSKTMEQGNDNKNMLGQEPCNLSDFLSFSKKEVQYLFLPLFPLL